MAAKIFKDTYDYMINSGSPDWYLNITSEINSMFFNDTIGLPLSSLSSSLSSSSSSSSASLSARMASASATAASASVSSPPSSSSTSSSSLSSLLLLTSSNIRDAELINATATLYNSETNNINDTLLLSSFNNVSDIFTLNDTIIMTTTTTTATTIINGKSSNISDTSSTDDIGELIIMAVTATILGLMILITVIGNVFVIAAIILERNLQNVANYLVASLAVADLFVACLVMPLGAVYEISKGWILGPELCDIWTSCDVLCCTASILHLVAIAIDRYWAVTNVDYIHSRTRSRVFTMICLVWFSAVIVSLAPQFGWKDPEYMERIEQQKCMVSQDVAYQVFATCSTFYVPLLVILVLYWKIYQTARKRIHRRRPKPIDITANNNQPTPQKINKKRLKISFGSKFSSNTHGKSAASSLGLVEGNSTNTVNVAEDTDYSSNVDSKKDIEITTTAFNSAADENPPSTSQISTVSHLVTLEHQKLKENSQNSHQNQSSVKFKNSTITINQCDQQDKYEKHQQQQQQDINNQSNSSTPSSPKTINIISTSVPTISTTSLTTTIPNIQSQQSSNQVTPISQNKQSHHIQQQQQQQQHQSIISTKSTTTSSSLSGPLTSGGSIPNPHSQVNKRKETLEAKRERKAAKTLAIITGAFVVCWLPFFLMALLLPLCGESCHINDTVASLFLWLGYFNSTLNPVIYTIFSPEFRQAFKRILFGGHRPVYYRP